MLFGTFLRCWQEVSVILFVFFLFFRMVKPIGACMAIGLFERQYDFIQSQLSLLYLSSE